jgi:adenylate cyclase
MAQAEWPLGKCEQAIAHVNQALELSPRDPAVGLWHFNIGNADFCLGRYEAAIKEYKYAIDVGYRTHLPYTYMAATYSALGNGAEAKAALDEARRINPNLTSIKWVIAHFPLFPPLFDGLRKAGLPEE